jgi:hypothetical protein
MYIGCMNTRGEGRWTLENAVLVSVLASVLGACGNRDDSSTREGSGTTVAARAFADVRIAVPQGWTSQYDQGADAWEVVSADRRATVRIERADERYVASPDAYLNHLTPRWGTDKLVTILDRRHIGSGFVLTVGVFAGESDPNPQSATYVVRKLGKLWYRCHTENVDDEALREQVIALCRSVRLP